MQATNERGHVPVPDITAFLIGSPILTLCTEAQAVTAGGLVAQLNFSRRGTGASPAAVIHPGAGFPKRRRLALSRRRLLVFSLE